MKIPNDHLRYLGKPFVPKSSFPLTAYSFTADEVLALSKYGHWFMALERGWIRPLTPMQEHFVACCSGSTPPTSSFETLWLKYTNSVANELAEGRGVQARVERLQDSLVAIEQEAVPEHPDDHKWHLRAINELESELKNLRGKLER